MTTTDARKRIAERKAAPAPSMAEVLCKGVLGVECSHVPGKQPTCERDAQALAAAGFGHVASVEAERDRWKAAWEMADPILTERDRLAARVAAVRALADDWGISGTEGGFDDDFAEAIRESGAWRFARDLRRALDGEATP